MTCHGLIKKLQVYKKAYITKFYQGGTKLRGHTCCFDMNTEYVINKILPHSLNSVSDRIKIIFAAPTTTPDQLRAKALKPFMVRRDKVGRFVDFLVHNNPLYADVQVDHSVLTSLGDAADGTLAAQLIDDPSQGDRQVVEEPAHMSAPDDSDDTEQTSVEVAFSSRLDLNITTLPADESEQVCVEPSTEGVTNDPPNTPHTPTDLGTPPSTTGMSQHAQPSTSDPQVVSGSDPVYVIHRSNTIVSQSLDSTIAGMYPHLFPFGKPAHGRVVPMSRYEETRYWLSLSTRRFAQDVDFLLVMFNICGRADVAQSSRRYFLSGKVNQDGLLTVTGPQLKSQLDYYTRRQNGSVEPPPNSGMAGPLISGVKAAASVMPGSNHQRAVCRRQLFSMMFTWGTPTFFLTISPADYRSPVVVKLAGENDFEHLTQSDKCHVASSNPMACATYFDRVISLILDVACNFSAKDQRPRSTPGLFGHLMGHFGMVETQGRGTLHLHMLLWTLGPWTSSRELTQAFVAPSALDAMSKFLSGVIASDLGIFNNEILCPSPGCPGTATADLTYLHDNEPTMTRPGGPSMPEPELIMCSQCDRSCGTSAVQKRSIGALIGETRYNEVMAHPDPFLVKPITSISGGPSIRALSALKITLLQSHDFHHRKSCFKKGDGLCRFSFPHKPDSRSTHISMTNAQAGDSAPVWHAHFKRGITDAYINTFSRMLTLVFGCNTDCKFLVSHEGDDQSRDTAYYVAKYTTKDQDDTVNPDLMVAAFDLLLERQEHERSSGTPITQQRALMARALSLFSAMSSQAESEPNIAALYFSGGARGGSKTAISYPSHDFHSIPVIQILAFMRSQPLVGVMVQLDEHSQWLSTFVINYCHRGAALEYMSPYHFVMHYQLKAKPRKPHPVVPGPVQPVSPDSDTLRSGENGTRIPPGANLTEILENNFEDQNFSSDQYPPNPVLGISEAGDAAFPVDYDYYDLLEHSGPSQVELLLGHPQANTHYLARVTRPVIPEWKGCHLPLEAKLGLGLTESQLNEMDPFEVRMNRETCAMIMLSLFWPWRRRADLVGDGSDWWGQYANWHNQPTYVRQFRERMQAIVLSASSHSRNVTPGQQGDPRPHPQEGDELTFLGEDSDDEDDDPTANHDDLINTVLADLESTDSRTILPAVLETVGRLERIRACLLVDQNQPDVDPYQNYEVSTLSTPQVNELKEAIKEHGHDEHSTGFFEALRQHHDGSTVELVQKWQRLSIPTRVQIINEALLNRNRSSSDPMELPQPTLKEFPTIAEASAHANLNEDQHAAFIYIAGTFLSTLHRACVAEDQTPAPHLSRALTAEVGFLHQQLLMYLGGQGGCGKSHLLKAVRAFVTQWGFPDAVKFTATTGAAAIVIGGATLHSQVQLSRKQASVVNEQRRFDGTQILVIDEISMMSLRLLWKLNKRLQLIKGNTQLFGGMHVVFVGDFMQLPPVGGRPLYSNFASTSSDEHFASAIWNQHINTVVILKTSVRAANDNVFAGILGRIRTKQLTEADCAMINSRAIGENIVPPPHTVIVTMTNMFRSDFNRVSMDSHLRQHPRVVFSIPGVPSSLTGDSCPLPAGKRQLILTSRDGGKNKLLGTLTLYVGMPVSITANISVAAHGIANGTQATVVDVIFAEHNQPIQADDVRGFKVLRTPDGALPLCVLVKVRDATFQVQGYDEGVFPLFPKKNIDVFDADGKHILGRLNQFPIVPAYAFTGHKVQGITLDSVLIADTENKRLKSTWLYTVLSRATSLNGLFLTKPIPELLTKCVHSPELHEYVNMRLPALDCEARQRLTRVSHALT